MAEEQDGQEKTEQPSLKRLREAREKGQVARSKDFNAMIILVCSGGGFLLFGNYLATDLAKVMRNAFEFDVKILITPQVMLQHLYFLTKTSILGIIPLFVLMWLFAFLAPLLMGGWIFSLQALQPKLSRLSPIKGVQRMISLKGLMEMVKSFLKFILVAVMALIVLRLQVPSLLSLAHHSLQSAITNGLSIVGFSFLIVCASLILIALIDVPFQWYEHMKQLKMTKQEVKDEYKELEGRPEVKSHIRHTQQEMAKKRMMTEVPKADVVLTNPTHYSVAIRYHQQGNRAPVVVAKGKDLIALQINRVAQANQVPQLSLPPLARAIYFSTDINDEIPRGLYVAVAQVLAYIFQIRDSGNSSGQPDFLNDLPIPEEYRRDAEEGV